MNNLFHMDMDNFKDIQKLLNKELENQVKYFIADTLGCEVFEIPDTQVMCVAYPNLKHLCENGETKGYSGTVMVNCDQRYYSYALNALHALRKVAFENRNKDMHNHNAPILGVRMMDQFMLNLYLRNEKLAPESDNGLDPEIYSESFKSKIRALAFHQNNNKMNFSSGVWVKNTPIRIAMLEDSSGNPVMEESYTDLMKYKIRTVNVDPKELDTYRSDEPTANLVLTINANIAMWEIKNLLK